MFKFSCFRVVMLVSLSPEQGQFAVTTSLHTKLNIYAHAESLAAGSGHTDK